MEESNIYRSRVKHFILAHRYGIMGTVIFHLLLLIILLTLGISKMATHIEMEIEIDMPDPEIIQQIKEEREYKEEIIRKSADDEVQEMLRSIAVNEDVKRERRSNRSIEDIDKYIKEIQDELEGSYGDRYAVKKGKHHDADSLAFLKAQRQRMLDSLQATLYVGESSVSYLLKDRYRIFLPIPVFKCEFGGKVVVDIVVNRNGSVIKATVVESDSDSDECLRETATDAALRSRFNQDSNAPERQGGTITYNFVKQ